MCGTGYDGMRPAYARLQAGVSGCGRAARQSTPRAWTAKALRDGTRGARDEPLRAAFAAAHPGTEVLDFSHDAWMYATPERLLQGV
jgi:hypothetical protein